MRELIVICAIGLMSSTMAASQQSKVPIAVVEDVSKNVKGIGFMDYVFAGDTIILGASDKITLGYMKSCVREIISGGTVTVGTEQSLVDSGTVARSKINCDGGRMRLSGAQAVNSAAMAFRNAPKSKAAATRRVDVLIFGSSPLFDTGGGDVTLDRLDRRDEHRVFSVNGQRLVRGRFFDLAEIDLKLVPGGTYKASSNGKEVVFKIDDNAQPGKSPAAGRLIRFDLPQ